MVLSTWTTRTKELIMDNEDRCISCGKPFIDTHRADDFWLGGSKRRYANVCQPCYEQDRDPE